MKHEVLEEVVPRDRRHDAKPTDETSSSYLRASGERCITVSKKCVVCR